MKYDFGKIEKKWSEKWLKDKTYEPDIKKAKKPFYNLMMFPYPSGEGLHVGNMYAFTGSDIYGRYKRMQGYDVFEPIGLDGFGIHSENYALKVGTHPAKQAKVSERRFYKQLRAIGNGFAWDERLQTYDPEYYKWTQWIFTQMWKRGLAYRKKQAVNWCPSCKTVLADEQVISGKCERCSSVVIKKELEQWFFRITKYAEKLLKNLKKLDWSEKVKIAQRNWIGRSEGAEIDFEIRTKEKPNFVLLHGYNGSPRKNFFPWLKKELVRRGYRAQAPRLPRPEDPRIKEQVDYVLKIASFDRNTILVGHSLGGVVALKTLERLAKPIRKTVLVTSFLENRFLDNDIFESHTFDWRFDKKKICRNAGRLFVLRDLGDDTVPSDQSIKLVELFGGTLIDFTGVKPHARGAKEPGVLCSVLDTITVFTTRPDTLFGATYMVVAPEHPLIKNLGPRIENAGKVRKYIKKAGMKSEEERIAEAREKTGVELRGVKAVNPANKKEIPVWVADYVLGNVGTGAIMAVPAHDERDFEFARKYKLPITKVISPILIRHPEGVGVSQGAASNTVRIEGDLWEGEGELMNSGKFNGMDSEKARWEITKFVGGRKQIQYRLRDWLISRQRYWGPPIPMIYCEKCALRDASGQGWQPVPEKDLPVRLPYVKNFRPTGTGKSPLASVKSFYKTKCPKCGGKAKRETDVSDTFLDSAWYYLRYPSTNAASKRKLAWDPVITRKWLPVNMYIGGAEHSVLHLLYSRFLGMAFHDLKLTDYDEPFVKFRAHGLLISEGAKMSKSKGNVVVPDEYMKKFSTDVLRMYLMFLAPFDQGGDFRDAAILGVERFLNDVWRYFSGRKKLIPRDSRELKRILHSAIKNITEDIESLKYNTAISELMILKNAFVKRGDSVSGDDLIIFLKLLAPFAPYMAEEIWHAVFGKRTSIHKEKWPVYNPKLMKSETFTLVIQVNGKVRDTMEVDVKISEAEVKKLAFGRERIKSFLSGRKPRRIIYVPQRILNIVV